MRISTKKHITTISKFILLFGFLFSEILFSQSILFVKYKDSVPLDAVDVKLDAHTSVYQTDKSLKADLFDRIILSSTGDASERIKRIRKITLLNEGEANSLREILSGDDEIEYVQGANLYKVDYIPNDSLLAEQWALENLNVFDAWDITTGSDEIILGVIDTGIDFYHPDLKNRIYINPAEDINSNGFYDEGDNDGIDNDGNGFTDDVFGWDFTDRDGFPFDSAGGDYLQWDNYPMDEQGHGTYISGIIGAEADNVSGVAGIMQKGKILNLRAFDPAGYGEEDDVAAAILYAVSMGVDVINMSFGDNAFSFVLKDIIEYAYSQGVVLVASSGNSGSSAPHYPSGYSQVICVGSSTENNYVNAQSNYGSTLDLVAPGVNILTTDRNGKYAKIAGTSASAPFVSATAALLLSLENYNSEEIKQILKSTSVDILNEGWDEKSGAGRLDIAKAVEVSAPSIVKINHPLQDYATLKDTMHINATVLSAYFQSYSLYYGIGDNPEEWTNIILEGKYQFKDELLDVLDISAFADTVYTLRLEVNLFSGRTLEERLNFHVDHTPPKLQNVSLGPVYYGEEPTILAAFMTDEYAVVKMYYREQGNTEFDFITLDGFTVNNQFFKQLHYGFLPKTLINYNTPYEIYFEAVNLAGLSTIYKNDGNNFVVTTQDYYYPATNEMKNYHLPAGDIFDQTAELSGAGDVNIMSNEYPMSQNLVFYRYLGGDFQVLDTLEGKRPITLADMNGDGKYELFSNFARKAYLESQQQEYSTKFNTFFEDTTETFWPVTAGDIDGDGLWELIGVKDDVTISIKEVSASLAVTNEAELTVPDAGDIFGNILLGNAGVIADINYNNKKELWVVDSDGNILGYEAIGADNYQLIATISSGLWGNRAKLTTGDYNGDGEEDVAVLLQTNDALHIAPVYYFYVFNVKNNELNIIAQNAILNPSNEFISTVFRDVRSSIKLADLNGDARDEMLIFVFPYAYVFDYNNGENNVIYYSDGINSNKIFVGDLDGNGKVEFSLPHENGTDFIELEGMTTTPVPLFIESYSLTEKSVYLSWNARPSVMTSIFRSENGTDFSLIGEVNQHHFIDSIGLTAEKTYYYKLQGNNSLMENPLSGFTAQRAVFVHKPAEAVSAEAITSKHIKVKFDGRINKTIENLESFIVNGVGRPNSISASDDNSYLLTMPEPLPTGDYSIVISKLRDDYGSPVKETTLNFGVSPTATSDEFFITAFSLVDTKTLLIEFNLPVDLNSALITSNYEVMPDYNYSDDVQALENSASKIKVHFKNNIAEVGRDFKIKLRDVYSVGPDRIKINDGAGSVIVISNSANDLSDIFVYPNPSNGAENITFANIPKRVKIIIFTIKGKRVTELEEFNGDGGLQWDLTDESGTSIGSGIYIYKITSLDELGNEIETKLEKFAVIK